MINSTGMIGNEYAFYQKIEPELKLIIDVGAAESFFIGVDCEIHFFEPDPIPFEELSKHRNKNYFFNKKGLGSKNSEANLYNEIGSVYNRFNNDELNIEKIEILRLDSYIEEHRIEKISLLKIDTEGMEYEILCGMGHYLDICDYIVFEYAWDTAEAAGVSFSNLKDILKNYNLYEMDYNGNLVDLDEPRITARVRPNTNNIVAKNKKNEHGYRIF